MSPECVLIIIQQELNKAQENLEQERQLISAVNEELKELERLHKQKSSEVTDHNLEIQKLEHEMDRQNREHQHSRDMVASLEEEHEWIADQKQYVLQVSLYAWCWYDGFRFFGQPGSSFDFAAMNMTETRKNVQQLRTKHDSMRKKINVRVMSMIDK